jgi:hypothetical protein
MAAYATLLQELVDLVEGVSGLSRVLVPVSDQAPAQALGGGFTVHLTGGADTGDLRGRSLVRDEHNAEIVLWYLADHNDRLATEKTALDDVISIRDAVYPSSRAITGATPTAWSYSLDVVAGGEVLRSAISLTLEHTTPVN